MHGAIAQQKAAAAPDQPDERRCAYVVGPPDVTGPPRYCGAVCRPRSAYCPEHHARCHLRDGSLPQRRRLLEIEALAAAVGGKRARAARLPSVPSLKRLERAAKAALARPDRSCFVHKEDDDAPNS